MNEYSEQLRERLLDFSTKMLQNLKRLPDSKEAQVIKYQLSKASTSIGANYWEALAAGTKRDFINKVQISLKEAYETQYWIELIGRIYPEQTQNWQNLATECREIIAIFSKTLITSKENLAKSKPRTKK